MSLKIESTFVIASWEEEVSGAPDKDRRVTKASVSKTYSGGLDGTGDVDYLMVYVNAEHAEFVGVEQFKGSLNGKSGGFVFRHTGSFHEGVVNSVWDVIADSGYGELAGLSGEVKFEAGHAAEYPIVFEGSFTN